MTVSMKRFLRQRSAERGATLTGYALLTAGLVVVSLGAIQGVNTSSQTVLDDTASSVGTPRASVSATKTGTVAAAPSWATPSGVGYCSPGLDGCPLGVPLPFNPSDHVPTMDTIPATGSPFGPPALPNNNLQQVHDPAKVFVAQESLVQLNGDWIPPDGDKPASGSPATPTGVLPGDKVCSFIVHVSPGNPYSGTNFAATIEFQGLILGTAYNKNTTHIDETTDTFGSPDISLANQPKLENSDKFDYSGNTLNITKFRAGVQTKWPR